MLPADEPPDLSIVTVNYNTGDLLLNCLRSVYENTHGLRFECIVVDNASPECAGLADLALEFPHVRLIENPENLGFAGGCNAGLEAARGRHILLLNPDTTVAPHALDRMARFLDSRSEVAVLWSPLVCPDGRDQAVAGRGFPTPFGLGARAAS